MKQTDQKFRRIAFIISLIVIVFNSGAEAHSEIPAKKLFGNLPLPAAMKPKVHGGYTRGCFSGAKALPVDGPNWQTMRLSRNRRWGHPTLVRIIEELSINAATKGWNGLMIGDMSQPRGGPMLNGHRSHQNGLDADIWFTPMPERRLSYEERENIRAVSVLKSGSNYVDGERWTSSHSDILHIAAKFPEVERVLVHPGVKKKLCDSVKGDRAWLRKIRPFWGHHYHFHLRIGCPKGSPGCKKQNATPKSIGCDKSLAWWFKSALAPRKQAKKPSKKKPRHLKLSNLPEACRSVLKADARGMEASTHRIKEASFAAPQINIPAFSPLAAIRSTPIEPDKSATPQDTVSSIIPIPMRRPAS